MLICFLATSVSAKDIMMKCYHPKNSSVTTTLKLEKKWFSSNIYYREAGRWKQFDCKFKIEDDFASCDGIQIDFIDKVLWVSGRGKYNCQ